MAMLFWRVVFSLIHIASCRRKTDKSSGRAPTQKRETQHLCSKAEKQHDRIAVKQQTTTYEPSNHNLSALPGAHGANRASVLAHIPSQLSPSKTTEPDEQNRNRTNEQNRPALLVIPAKGSAVSALSFAAMHAGYREDAEKENS